MERFFAVAAPGADRPEHCAAMLSLPNRDERKRRAVELAHDVGVGWPMELPKTGMWEGSRTISNG